MEQNNHRPALLGLTLAELGDVAARAGLPRFAASQMAGWLYQKGVVAPSEMTNLKKSARAWLSEHYVVGAPSVADRVEGRDGTVKYLFRTASGHFVESVFIPSGERATLCVSSQVGCKRCCSFCMTGRQGFNAQLSVADIVGQVSALPEHERLTNVVFMGQGEPCDNLDAVLRAVEVLTAPWGYAWSPKRITISTVGTGERPLRRLVEECNAHIAVSLHNAVPSERALLMPSERAFSIERTVSVLGHYEFARRLGAGMHRAEAHQRRLSFEYIVFAGINDSRRHADALLSLLRPLDCRVNLIRFHPIPDCALEGVAQEQMLALRDYLTAHGLFATVRASRGEDIWAACGLLSTRRQEAAAHTRI